MPSKSELEKLKADPQRWEKYKAQKLEQNKRWAAKNKEKRRATNARYYSRNREQVNASTYLYKEAVREIREMAAAQNRMPPHLSLAEQVKIYDRIVRALSDRSPTFRDDVATDLFIAIREGKISTDFTREDVERFVRRHFQRYEHLGMSSLDQIIGYNGLSIGHALGVYP